MRDDRTTHPSPGDRCRTPRPVSGWASLTETELRVAAVVSEGRTNADAAACLFLSRHTVDFHLRQIFRKLMIHSRVELVRFAMENGALGSTRRVG
ncbi:MAG: ATPase-like protein [Acidimicrobiales bacterium]|nr:ATPase-like protein [Acidimicrobiales bacterium]